MIKPALKTAAWVLLLCLVYKVATVYAVYRMATYSGECSSLEKLCRLAEQRAPNQEVTSTMAEAFACIQRKQSVVESWLVPLPRHFVDPPPASLSFKDAERACKGH